MTDGGWRDHEPGRTGLSVAELNDDESMECEILSEPFRRDTEESADALHVPVKVVEAPSHVEDMSGSTVDDETEYNIINSSTSFFNALVDAYPPGEEMTGEVVVITAHQPEAATSRYYEIN